MDAVIEESSAERDARLAKEQAAQERWERQERAGEVVAEALIEELEAEFPGGQMLATYNRGGSVRFYYGVEIYSGTTPQSERWVGVEVSAHVSSAWSGTPTLAHMELSPERMTRTGRRVRGGFYCPDVNLDGYNTIAEGGSITCSSGPALNGGEGPGRMAMFLGCLRIAERVLARCEAGQL